MDPVKRGNVGVDPDDVPRVDGHRKGSSDPGSKIGETGTDVQTHGRGGLDSHFVVETPPRPAPYLPLVPELAVVL